MPTPLDYDRTPPSPWKPRVLRGLMILGLIILLGPGSCVTFYYGVMQPSIGQNVSRTEAKCARWLPPDASAVSYRVGGAFDPVPLCFECSTSEASFRAWVAPNGWDLKTGEWGARRFDNSRVTVANALYYNHLDEDRTTQAVYDLDTGRMYFYKSSR